MKKAYINPEIQVMMLQQSQMLCSSLTDIMGMDDTPVDLLNDSTDDIDKIEDIW